MAIDFHVSRSLKVAAAAIFDFRLNQAEQRNQKSRKKFTQLSRLHQPLGRLACDRFNAVLVLLVEEIRLDLKSGEVRGKLTMSVIAKALRRAIALSGIVLFAADAEAAPISGCYVRHYKARHLATHPGQRVRNIILSLNHMPGNDPWVASANLRMVLKGQKGFRNVSGDCAQEGGALTCAGD